MKIGFCAILKILFILYHNLLKSKSTGHFPPINYFKQTILVLRCDVKLNFTVFLLIFVSCSTNNVTNSKSADVRAKESFGKNQFSQIPASVKLPESELKPYAKDMIAEAYKIQGFEVEWGNDEKDKKECLKALQIALYQIKNFLPPPTFAVLKSKQFRFSEDPNRGAAAIYLGGLITIFNKKEFIQNSLRITFHELAHGYDDSFVSRSYLNKEGIYESAISQKIYSDSIGGVNEYDLKNYLTSNPAEYFAELSCSYFIGLHYFPYDRKTLKEKDPEGYKLIEDAWIHQNGKDLFPDVKVE